MQVSAHAKRLRISAQKARLVADQVRGKPVAEALDILNFSRVTLSIFFIWAMTSLNKISM